ncbi:MAG: hypothetical protein HY719_09830 [Planctomycetes bacterium]|nr:hypothetical protein [Planctomycetota bacterium]
MNSERAANQMLPPQFTAADRGAWRTFKASAGRFLREFRKEAAVGIALGAFGAALFLYYLRSILEGALICGAAAGIVYFAARWFWRATRAVHRERDFRRTLV